jgi:hypothetical protein
LKKTRIKRREKLEDDQERRKIFKRRLKDIGIVLLMKMKIYEEKILKMIRNKRRIHRRRLKDKKEESC